jgi:hypothetical protein
MRREAAATQFAMQREIDARDDTISANFASIGVLNKRLNYLVSKNVSAQLQEYSVNKAHFCLRAWIARYRA